MLTLAAGPAASEFVLQQPVDCKLGSTCHIQNYVDHDSGPGVRDFACGGLTYDGHKGTDFALSTRADMQKGVNVVAAAAGVVNASRDGMDDILYDPSQPNSVENRECGNGVLIAHENGWETQYCHLRQGSIVVSPGDNVEAGTVLGQIGLSGKTQFPHLHLSVRKDGQVVDPFTPNGAFECDQTNDGLWAQNLEYVAGGLISAGFSDRIPEYDDVLAGSAARKVMPSYASAIVLFGLAFGTQAGDIIRLEIDGPSGEFMSEDVGLDRAQAQAFRAIGRRLSSSQWPAGTYSGKVTMIRAGDMISVKNVDVVLR